MEIIPSILVSKEEELHEKISQVEELVDRVHLDIADGILVPNTTIEGYPQLARIDTDLGIGVHLMVSKPENHIAHWMDTQADRYIFHAHATDKHEDVIDILKENDAQVGIALSPEVPVEEITEFIDAIDFVHFMTVEPGFYGADFVEDVVEKIKDFHFMYPDIEIEVDGDVNPTTAPRLAEAGATKFVAGSWIFDNKTLSIEEAITKLRASIEQ